MKDATAARRGAGLPAAAPVVGRRRILQMALVLPAAATVLGGCSGVDRRADRPDPLIALADAARRAAGVHFTRPALASGLVALAAGARPADGRTGGTALDAGEVALDPACGAGAFLVAVARHLVATSTDPSDPLSSSATPRASTSRSLQKDPSQASQSEVGRARADRSSVTRGA